MRSSSSSSSRCSSRRRAIQSDSSPVTETRFRLAYTKRVYYVFFFLSFSPLLHYYTPFWAHTRDPRRHTDFLDKQQILDLFFFFSSFFHRHLKFVLRSSTHGAIWPGRPEQQATAAVLFIKTCQVHHTSIRTHSRTLLYTLKRVLAGIETCVRRRHRSGGHAAIPAHESYNELGPNPFDFYAHNIHERYTRLYVYTQAVIRHNVCVFV